jgi:drug/metabolite transporter (DMT)-like permease
MFKQQQPGLSLHPYFLLFISILSVSISSILIKFFSETPTSVAGMYRLFITVLIMLPFVSWSKLASLEMGKRDWLTVILAGVFIGLHFLFWMESLVHTSVASSMVILTLQPLFVMVGSYFMFKEKAGPLTIACMLAALLGSVIIAWGDIGISREALIGDGLSLVGTLMVSAYMLAGQKVSRKLDAKLYSVVVFAIGGLVLLVYNVVNKQPLIQYEASHWIYFLLLAIIPTVLGQYIFNILLKSVGATTVSVGIIGEPVIAILLAFVLLGESISRFQWAGGLLTLLGMGMYFWLKSSTAKRNVITIQNGDAQKAS